MYNLALDPSVLSWCHLDTRAPEAAASLQLYCRPGTHTRDTHMHIPKAATGLHSLGYLQSLPHGHMEFLTRGLTAIAGTRPWYRHTQ